MLLEVTDWHVHFAVPAGDVHAVCGVDLSIQERECVAIVGESGSGKSQLLQSLFGLQAANGRTSGNAMWRGQKIPDPKSIVGREVGFIFQDPLTSLTPHMTIGAQMREALVLHGRMSDAEADRRSLALLERCQLHEPALRLRQYPHELSGGMRQRVMIAQAIANNPALLIADEPTTALDVTVQAEILQLLQQLQKEMNLAIVFITHDIRIAAKMAQRVMVMKKGQVVEAGSRDHVFKHPAHKYTQQLLAAFQTKSINLDGQSTRRNFVPVVNVKNIGVAFRQHMGFFRRRDFQALESISFSISPGECLAVVGESGSGKSTLARAVAGLVAKQAGCVEIAGTEILKIEPRLVQTVFQDPFAALNPRQRVGRAVREGLDILHSDMPLYERDQRVRDMFDRVGLPSSFLSRYPHELSGGQCQRVGICRALLANPKLLICDEAISALDVTTAVLILDLLQDIKTRSDMAMMFITHDLAAAERLAEHILVLDHGKIVEMGNARQIMHAPVHPRTKALLEASLI